MKRITELQQQAAFNAQVFHDNFIATGSTNMYGLYLRYAALNLWLIGKRIDLLTKQN